MDRIDAIEGQNQQARLIREAVEHALRLAKKSRQTLVAYRVKRTV